MARLLFSFIIASLFCTACSNSEEQAQPVVENTRQHIRLSLTLPYAEETRAETQGANQGDSHDPEDAFPNEFSVSSISLFVFSGTNGLNSSSYTPILESHYLTSTSTEFKQNGNDIIIDFESSSNKIGIGDRLIALINMGDLTAKTTLGDIQQYIPSQTWVAGSGNASPSACSGFSMANASNFDGTIVIKTSSSKDSDNDSENGSDPNNDNVTYFSAELEVERTAARIDINPDGATFDNNNHALRYDVYSTISTKTGTLYVSHILPVNVMQQSSYALKRISKDATSFDDYTYTGTLDKGTGGMPVCYVIEPHTASKSNPDAIWYGNTAIKKITDAYFIEDNRISKFYDSTSENAGEKPFVLAYANENTHSKDILDADCLTGLVIKAQFVPEKVYSSTDLTTHSQGKLGDDIWRCTPREVSSTESDAIYFGNEAAAKEYARSGNFVITKFKAGVCYYNLWIRHTVIDEKDRPTSLSFPMEYGIVRNHIYRIKLGFQGIGHDKITFEDPMNVKPEIFVRPWRLRVQPEIIM